MLDNIYKVLYSKQSSVNILSSKVNNCNGLKPIKYVQIHGFIVSFFKWLSLKNDRKNLLS